MVFALLSVPATSTCWRNIWLAKLYPVSLFTNSSAISIPRPRTSCTRSGYSRASARKPSSSISPFCSACAGRFSSSSTLMVASAAAQASGLPPKVVVCRNGLSNSTEKTSSVAIVAPIGITPPPRALARHIMSGCTFSCSQANILPVRPIPVCTSSKISSAPNSSHSLRTAGR